jgi:hypothetical protein
MRAGSLEARRAGLDRCNRPCKVQGFLHGGDGVVKTGSGGVVKTV